MQNLAQLRAANAFTVLDEIFPNLRSKDGRAALNGYAALIHNNGLIAAVAYSLHKGDEMLLVANALAYHLENFSNNRSLIPPIHPIPKGANFTGKQRGAARLIRSLSKQDCELVRLMHCADEALAFLTYLKRLASQDAAPAPAGQHA